MLRIVGIATVIVVAPLLALIQIASAAVFSSSAVEGSFPSRLAPSTGARVYSTLARIAPMPMFEAMLAQYALQAGDPDGAAQAIAHLPDSPMRDELLGRVALLRGDHRQALEAFLAAPDVRAVSHEVNREAFVDPQGAYQLETRLLDRLTALTTHPDAVADAYWRLGELGKYAHVAPAVSMQNFQQAVDLAPFNVRYLLAAGRQAQRLRDASRAQQLFEQAVAADPSSRKAAAALATLHGSSP